MAQMRVKYGLDLRTGLEGIINAQPQDGVHLPSGDSLLPMPPPGQSALAQYLKPNNFDSFLDGEVQPLIDDPACLMPRQFTQAFGSLQDLVTREAARAEAAGSPAAKLLAATDRILATLGADRALAAISRHALLQG